MSTVQKIKKISCSIEKLMQEKELLINSIKGLKDYSKSNQELLLSSFDKKNIEKYISIEKNYHKKIYTAILNNKPIYIKYCGFGLGVSENGSHFQVTNHTVFTFCKEHDLKPESFSVFKR